jgi:hypothetical protein
MPADGCDFGTPDCPPVQWSYPCLNFTIDDGHTEHVSIGPWFACDDCSQLVEAGAWDVLLRRVVERAAHAYDDRPPEDTARVRQVVSDWLGEWYSMFRQRRVGGRERITSVHRLDADALLAELREDDG